jgi:two-component system chemotaxis response regulator CheB
MRRHGKRVIKLLVVDDSALMRRLLGAVFAAESDFDVAFARDGAEAIELLHRFGPDVITLDVQMPKLDGLACLDRIMVERPCPVVMVSSLTEAGADISLEAMQLGAVDFIAKPQGALSLAMDELAPLLVEKVRAASKARLRRSLRLTERVRRLANGPLPASAGYRGAAALPTAPSLRAKTPVPKQEPGPADMVVVVGCSTGGPPALDQLLSPLPSDFPWPILVAQHMPASFTGPLARRLDRLCAVTVVEVTTRPIGLQPGHVYIGKGDADMIVSLRPEGPVVMAAPSLPEHRWHPSVDRLMTTAIQHLGARRLIGVLMTGMGNDGAASMTRLRREGGRTIAEAEETAVVWGMPGELVKAGGAQVVTPVDAIADHLMAWVP